MTRELKQRVALITVFIFFASGLNVYPQQTSAVTETVRGASGESSLAPIQKELVRESTPHILPELNPYLITVPTQYGNIEEVYQGSQDAPLIVHIQNVHANYKAQTNIKNILDHLVRKHKFSLIQLEGAVATVDPEILKPSYLEEANLKLADFLLREGRITGAHAFAVETDQPVELYGIEDFDLYSENLKIFKSIYSRRQEVNTYFSNAQHMVERVGRTLLTPGALDFTRKKEAFSRDKITLLDYLVYLNEVAAKSGLTTLTDLKEIIRYPNLVRIMRIHEIEKKLDEAELKQEGERLRSEFSKKFPSSEAVQELLGRLEAREKGMRPRSYFVELTNLAAEAGIDFVGYPQIRLFAESLIYQDEIDHRGVFSELKRYEGDLEKTLFKTEDEQGLLEVISFVSLLEQFFRLEMSREKLALYLKDRDRMKPSWIEMRLAGLAEKRGINFTPLSAASQLDAYMDDLEYFYRVVLERDEVFIEKILAKMQALGTHKTILVTGGFHKDPLIEEFRRRELSYAVVSPGVDITEGSEQYVKVMLDEDSVAGTVFAGTFAVEVKDFGGLGPKRALANIDMASILLTAHMLPDDVANGSIVPKSVSWFEKVKPRSGVSIRTTEVDANDYSVRGRAEARFYEQGVPILIKLQGILDRSDLNFTVRTVKEEKVLRAELRNLGITEPPAAQPINRETITPLSTEALGVDVRTPSTQPAELRLSELSSRGALLVDTFVPLNDVPFAADVDKQLLGRLFSLSAPAARQVSAAARSGVLTREAVELATKTTTAEGAITPAAIEEITELSEGEKRLFTHLKGAAPQAPLFLVLTLDTVNQPEVSNSELLSLIERIQVNGGTAAAVYGVDVKSFALNRLGKTEADLANTPLNRILFVDQERPGIKLATNADAVDLLTGHIQYKSGLFYNQWRRSVPQAAAMSVEDFMSHVAILVPRGALGNRLREATEQRWPKTLQLIGLDFTDARIASDEELKRAAGGFQVEVLVSLRNSEAVALLYDLKEGALAQVGANVWQISGTHALLNLIRNHYRAEIRIRAAA